MTDRLLLLSTCGTSVLTNQADEGTRNWLVKIANKQQLDSGDEEGKLKKHAADRKVRLMQADKSESRRLSAELNGIAAVIERWQPARIQHLLIHTDTALGREAATLMKDVIEKDRQPVEVLTSGGLRTDNFPSFREALADLTRRIEELVPGYRKQGWLTIFNLTGGFKSVSAYIQALGMLYADRCVFLFEGSPALMEIPRLPVKLAEEDELRPHLEAFRRLAQGYPVQEEAVKGAPDSLLMIDDGNSTTSVWGDIVWARTRKKLFADDLLPPLSQKLLIVEKVCKAFKQFPTEKRVQVNEALDALSAHLDLGRALPASNTFKKLQGDPAPPSTHELYLWSDGAAWRLFGHYDRDERFHADSIGPHL